MCERYSELLMGLLDNELSDRERRDVELHLQECPDCQAEYREFERLARLTSSLKFPEPKQEVWDHYYEGVCQRMRGVASWGVWGAVSIALLALANVLFFALPFSPWTVGAGIACLVSGAVILWATFACNCT
ncbi:MAG: zf-HC2 domain-containing protein [Candidatus Sumerlaeaceae bacterium]|nr:zf-HC2 domain-containing protein [Candidatus Sumerlaeaceae bacterium]